MLCCIGEIGLFIFGIVTLIKGELKIGGGRVVRGVSARLCGVLLMIPLLGGQGGELIYGANKGFERGMQGQQFGEGDKEEIQKVALVINGIALGVPLLLLVVIALTQAESEDTFRRRRFEDDDDDRPRRRRRDDEEDEDDDRPRSRRRDEDEDEDRPRRRPPDDEEPDERIIGK